MTLPERALSPALPNWKADFPALAGTMNGKPLVYLDSGASAQKPRAVIDAMDACLTGPYANIHRGLYEFSQTTTAAYEAARAKIARFLGARDNEIVFTRNATEGVNLVAAAWGRANLKPGDEILLTQMEHHANLVPWHMLRDQLGIVVKYIPVTDAGELDLDKLPALVGPRTKLAAFVHVSNTLGTINPVRDLTARIRAINPETRILIDGAQSAAHMKIDVRDLGCDWFVMTGHKLYGPTGIGVLWGRADVLDAMPPYQGGGDMIERVTLDGSTYLPAPQRFEAGTPAIAEAIGLGAAVDYIAAIGWPAIAAHEKALADTLFKRLSARKDIRVIGRASHRACIVSFVHKTASAADIGMILDQCGVAVRVGHHCCQPLMDRFGVPGTVRASLALYNTPDDISALEAGLDKAAKLLS
ncbi:MAG: cysteine desulfurase [Rhodospirillales bacterium]|nr:cysteine desulfurase [Alphaproteobacteria bacterium]MCB9987478.1 cysteine desulfurase [Rhodospirillales bacterium]USO07547.1 MAG: cysteine desulfurase [Rhodospirillales bacterium]